MTCPLHGTYPTIQKTIVVVVVVVVVIIPKNYNQKSMILISIKNNKMIPY